MINIITASISKNKVAEIKIIVIDFLTKKFGNWFFYC